MRTLIICLLLAGSLTHTYPAPLLPRGHSHNDYYRDRPLKEALEAGFGSVEADIFLQNGELLVGHDREELTAERTLRSMYLDPLFERAEERDFKSIYNEPFEFQLMIDIKSEAGETLTALLPVLEDYRPMLSVYTNDSVTSGAVSVVLSGNRPVEIVRTMDVRYLAIDGRPDDLDKGETAAFMPMISSHYRDHFSWRGVSPMPDSEKQWLFDYASKARRNGQRIRFWAVPLAVQEHPDWLNSPVDYLNTDDPARLRELLISPP